MSDLFDSIAELMSYWTGPRLPLPLRKLRGGLIGQTMERYARLGLNGGIYEIIGGRIPPQCENPSAALRRVMGDVSVAFFVLEEYRQRGIDVGTNIRTPLVRALVRLFQALGDPRGANEAQTLVDEYVAAHSVPTPVTAEEFFHVPVLDISLLDQLRILQRESGRHKRRNRIQLRLNDVGLALDDEFDDSRYNHATPLNVRTFAATGGGGVHFSLMIRDGALSDDSPVVVTDPNGGGDDAHAIVGENLREFLNLGYYTGYFCFQGLASESQRDDLLRDLLHGPSARDDFANDFDHAQLMMRRLREEFDLEPWSDAGRFQSLQETYKPLLQLPPL